MQLDRVLHLGAGEDVHGRGVHNRRLQRLEENEGVVAEGMLNDRYACGPAPRRKPGLHLYMQHFVATLYVDIVGLVAPRKLTGNVSMSEESADDQVLTCLAEFDLLILGRADFETIGPT